MFVLLLGLAACGARSNLSLVIGDSSGGAGGTGGVGGAAGSGGGIGGTGGTGGTGGSTTLCDALVLVDPIVEVQRPPALAYERPALVRSSDDGQQLTVAFQRRDTTASNPPRQATHASFRPWQSWPAGPLSPTHTTFSSVDLDPTFAAGAGFGDRFALLVSHASLVDSFAPSVDPNGSDSGPNLSLASHGTPIFAAPGPPGRHLVADSEGHMLMGHIVDFTGASFDAIDMVLACGGNPSMADAVAYGDGWLLALGNEMTAPPTGCSAAANGPMRLDVLFVSPDGALAPVTSLDAGAPIVGISLAPHPDGAYVTWKVASGGIIAPIRWLRVDVPAASVIGPGDVSGPGDMPLDDFDATALGDRLAVVWNNDPANNPPDLTLTVLDPTGGQLAQTFIEPKFHGPLGIAGAPTGNSVVVSWQEGGGAVRLARFDCVGGL